MIFAIGLLVCVFQISSALIDDGCPHPCYAGGKKYCFPIPCPLPPCVDRAKNQTTDCCESCPNGLFCEFILCNCCVIYIIISKTLTTTLFTLKLHSSTWARRRRSAMVNVLGFESGGTVFEPRPVCPLQHYFSSLHDDWHYYILT